MVLYFSGTGNSQFIAKTIAEVAEDEIFSINNAIKVAKTNYVFSKKALVFVAPVYSWRIPRLVEDWVKKTNFGGAKEAYFVLTCGSSSGDATSYVKKLCKKMGFKFMGLNEIIMPENYIALFEVTNEKTSNVLIERGKSVAKQIAKAIKKGDALERKKVGCVDKFLSGPINPIFYKLFVHDKGFYASNKCIGCEKCVKLCPLNNIKLENNKPVWQGNCTHCMACISGCPTCAIEYKKKSIGQRRHFILDKKVAK